uniref:Uncharacterized protein n=1 Tax=Cucumis sativus TaxID=3659 RepID=A0A0A0KKS7_CUCSA
MLVRPLAIRNLVHLVTHHSSSPTRFLNSFNDFRKRQQRRPTAVFNLNIWEQRSEKSDAFPAPPPAVCRFFFRNRNGFLQGLYERRRLGSSGRTAYQLNVETTWFQKDLANVQDTKRLQVFMATIAYRLQAQPQLGCQVVNSIHLMPAALHIIQFTVILELHDEKFVSWGLKTVARHGMCECLRLISHKTVPRTGLYTQMPRVSPELLDFGWLFSCDEIVVKLI